MLLQKNIIYVWLMGIVVAQTIIKQHWCGMKLRLPRPYKGEDDKKDKITTNIEFYFAT